MFFLSLLKELATDTQSMEQGGGGGGIDSAAQKNVNQNLFIIYLLLKITIIHWLMHAVTMK